MEERDLARELRSRLVREVAAPFAQVKEVSRQFEEIRGELSLLEKAKGEFSNSIIDEFKSCVEKKEIGKKGIEIESRYNIHMQEYEQRKTEIELRHKKLEEDVKSLERKAWQALVRITNEVVASNYGRGVLQPHYNTTKITRVIGAIDDLDENLVYFAIWLQSRVEVSIADVKRVTEMCENGQSPLFHINIEVMPLDEEEIKSFCREVDDYWFLKKNIPENLIPWDLGYVYRIDRRNTGIEKSRVYMVMLGNGESVFVNMEIGVYPHRILTILGRIEEGDREKIDNIFDYILDWQGKENLPRDLEDIPRIIKDASDKVIVYSIFIHHAFDNFPGIIVDMPQLEK